MPITITAAPRLCRWVAVLALGLGLVAMHHLVGVHAHPGNSQDSSAGMAMLATPAESRCATSSDVAAMPAQPGSDRGLMLHLCLAVLTGLVLLARLVVVWRLAHALKPGLPSTAPHKSCGGCAVSQAMGSSRWRSVADRG